MSVKLRLMRFGKRGRPFYRVCAIDTRAPRDGAYLEAVGHYNPLIADDRKKISIDKERAEHWLRVGAEPSQTVASFLRMLNVAGAARPRKARKKRKPSAKKVAAAKARSAARKAAGKTKKKAAAKPKKEA